MQFHARVLEPGASHVAEVLLEARSAADLRERLASEGRVLLGARAAARGAAPSTFDASWWCRELRTLLRAGMTVVEAVDTLAAGEQDADRTRVHGLLLRQLHEGRPLSAAMRATGAFPAVLVAGVTASERTSTLVEALDDYLRYDEMLQRLRRQAVGAAIYPAMVGVVGLAISIFLLVFVIPRFSRIYVDFRGDVSTATHAILWLSQVIAQALPILLAVAAVAAALAIRAWRRGALQAQAAAIAERVPLLRAHWDHFRFAKLYQALALMFRGGYTFDEALASCSQLDLGPRIAAGLQRAVHDVELGKAPSTALLGAGLADLVAMRLLGVGERTGEFSAILQTIADRHATAFETFIQRASRLLEPLLLLLVALVVGGIVVLMYMPIFDIAGSLGAGH